MIILYKIKSFSVDGMDTFIPDGEALVTLVDGDGVNTPIIGITVKIAMITVNVDADVADLNNRVK